MQMKNSQCKLGFLKKQRVMFHIIFHFSFKYEKFKIRLSGNSELNNSCMNLEQFANLELQKRRNG